MNTQLFFAKTATALSSAWAKVGAIATVGLFTATAALAQSTTDPFGKNFIQIGLPANDPRIIASNIIKIFLGFLGIIAVAIVLVGGFKWMTALGDEEKVKEARKLIGSGVVGLIIIVAAYAIATFVLDQILTATTTR